ncbi:uncharacterized protein LOC125035860 isoform X2 [Penaeus chinensis]|uniref:uncharacterized protein LOC125035860 isoform X2 n=1 Tax=Penaeus chinensis TaxID=139456 RepID=UPI001FB7845D|nr:uncharacterized protein LOC125035860 isoform X2 [Penaeus chinensis]
MMEIDGHPRNIKSKKKRKDRKTNSDSHITWHKSEEYFDLTVAETQIQHEQYGKLDDHIKKKKKKEKVKLSEHDEGYPTPEKVLESTNNNQIMEDPCQMSFNTKKRKLSDCEDEEALIGEEVLELNNEIHKKLHKKKRKKKPSEYEHQDILESLLPSYQNLEATCEVSPKKKKRKKVSVSDDKNSLSEAISSSNIMEANASPQHQIMCKADVQIKEKKHSKKKKDSDNNEDEIHFQRTTMNIHNFI